MDLVIHRLNMLAHFETNNTLFLLQKFGIKKGLFLFQNRKMRKSIRFSRRIFAGTPFALAFVAPRVTKSLGVKAVPGGLAFTTRVKRVSRLVGWGDLDMGFQV